MHLAPNFMQFNSFFLYLSNIFFVFGGKNPQNTKLFDLLDATSHENFLIKVDLKYDNYVEQT